MGGGDGRAGRAGRAGREGGGGIYVCCSSHGSHCTNDLASLFEVEHRSVLLVRVESYCQRLGRRLLTLFDVFFVEEGGFYNDLGSEMTDCIHSLARRVRSQDRQNIAVGRGGVDDDRDGLVMIDDKRSVRGCYHNDRQLCRTKSPPPHIPYQNHTQIGKSVVFIHIKKKIYILLTPKPYEALPHIPCQCQTKIGKSVMFTYEKKKNQRREKTGVTLAGDFWRQQENTSKKHQISSHAAYIDSAG